MLKVLVNGCNGKMGQVVCDLVNKSETCELCAGFDREDVGLLPVKVFSNIADISVKPDVIIDFSIPVATFNILEYAKQNNVPVVIATTGFNGEEEMRLADYAKYIPIFKSANMSFDVNMMKHLVMQIAPKLKDTDIEITEVHHNRKVDSPSGTAQMLADSINEVLGNKYHCEYNRHDKNEKRDKFEIGMSSIRGGNIVGEHSVQFFGEFETFEIKHTSYSRNVFAEGAVKAAEFLVGKPNRLYNMDDLVSE
ncbi:MAG: 4-hydroxy-tetrahydrodipicolinate reductase [Clostridia bacterium]|nr:4-hydroxy-tetrahydrodipicolinate reductase [Clostridia bacterium]